jgi:phosphoglucosamine mutase
MRENGIEVVKTGVGDKYVVDEMRRNGFNLGGEQSGHIIFLDHSTTGDGVVAALNVLWVMRESGKNLSDLSQIIEDVPQVLINLRVKKKSPLHEIPGYKELVKDFEKKLQGEGRIFIRFSGTEPVLRVLIEGPDKLKINQYAESIAQFLEGHLNT